MARGDDGQARPDHLLFGVVPRLLRMSSEGCEFPLRVRSAGTSSASSKPRGVRRLRTAGRAAWVDGSLPRDPLRSVRDQIAAI